MKKLLALAAIVAAFSVGNAFAAGTSTDTYTINFTINQVLINIPDTDSLWVVNAEEDVTPALAIQPIPAGGTPPSLYLKPDWDYLQGSLNTTGTDNTISVELLSQAGPVPVNLYAQVTTQANGSDIGAGGIQSQLRVDFQPSATVIPVRVVGNYLPAGSSLDGTFQLVTAASEFNATSVGVGTTLSMFNWLHTQDAGTGLLPPGVANMTVFVAAQ